MKKCKIANDPCEYTYCPIYNHPSTFLRYKDSCKNQIKAIKSKEVRTS